MSLSNDEAIVKKQRVSRACDQCRKRKIKCDGFSPVCSHCQSLSLECTYKDTTKKRGPPKGYIEAIENRLQKLERYLKTVVDKDSHDPDTQKLLKELESPLETPHGVTINGRPQRRRKKNQKATTEDETYSTDLSSNRALINSPISPLFGSPTLSHIDLHEDQPSSSNLNHPTCSKPKAQSRPTQPDGSLSIDEHGQVRYLGNSSGFYLLSDSRTYKNGVFHFTGYYHRLNDEQKKLSLENYSRRYKVDPLALPDKDLSEKLMAIYFEHLYPVLPMFYKKCIFDQLGPDESVSPLLLNAIYAIASRMAMDAQTRSDLDGPEMSGDVFYERARCLLDDYYDTPKISTIQALLLLASHQMGAMKPAKAWLYSGMAFRMAQDLGLNRNCDHWNIQPEERERRKRVFWCCYIVDRLMCAIYGRSANFDERDCDVPFPSVDDDEPISSKDPSRPPTRLLDIFIESIKVADILGHVLKNIYYVKAKYRTDSQLIDRILNTLHKQLIQWHSNLSPALQYRLPNTQFGEKIVDPPSAICQLHLMYYTTLILLHRSFIPGPKQTQLPISLPCYKICETAATSVMDIVNIMLGENHLRYVYNFSVFYVFTAGIIFVKLASSDDPDRAFDAKINTNRIMSALDNLEITWMNASRCCNILGELAGLRDVKLEVDTYVPTREKKASPPPSIAVPNSPDASPTLKRLSPPADTILTEESKVTQSTDWMPTVVSTPDQDSELSSSVLSSFPVSSVRDSIQSHRPDQSRTTYPSEGEMASFINITPTMDPFAAPGILPAPQNGTFDPLGTAFWGMPTSLNIDEWNDYLSNLHQPASKESEPSLITDLLVSMEGQLSKSIEAGSKTSHSPSQSVLFGFLEQPELPKTSQTSMNYTSEENNHHY